MADPFALKYRAFISYSHADTSWAKWLHRGLEGFRIDKDLVGRETAKGPVPKVLRPIFRDRDDFTAGHSLNDQTLTALDASAALIVICSPASARSAYVTEEIRLFKSRHAERPVIPLIVDGKPGDPHRLERRGDGRRLCRHSDIGASLTDRLCGSGHANCCRSCERQRTDRSHGRKEGIC
jgi:hypothetical protein